MLATLLTASAQNIKEKQLNVFLGDIDSNFQFTEYVESPNDLLIFDVPFFYLELLKMNDNTILDTIDLMSGNFHFFIQNVLQKKQVYGTCQPFYRYDFFKKELSSGSLNKINNLLTSDSTNRYLKLIHTTWLNYDFRLPNELIDSIIPLFSNLDSIQESIIRHQFLENDITTLDFWINEFGSNQIILFTEYFAKIPIKACYIIVVNKENRKEKFKKIQKTFAITKKQILNFKPIILKDGSEIKLILIE